MANKYAGTKTEKNLLEAFAGESQARNKYTYFASVAKKAGYEIIGRDELPNLDIDTVSKYSAKFFPNDATSTRYSHKTGIQSYKLNFVSDVKRYLLDEASFLEENEEKEISLFNMKFLIKK